MAAALARCVRRRRPPAQDAQPSRPAQLRRRAAAEGVVLPPGARTQGDEPTLAQQKASLRGAQRMARLDAMRWYGFSNSRPTASAMPWTTHVQPGVANARRPAVRVVHERADRS